MGGIQAYVIRAQKAEFMLFRLMSCDELMALTVLEGLEFA